MKKEILPCPFCGAQPKFTHIKKEDAAPELPNGYWSLGCPYKSTCTAHPSSYGGTKAAALADWNTRFKSPSATLHEGPKMVINVNNDGVWLGFYTKVGLSTALNLLNQGDTINGRALKAWATEYVEGIKLAAPQTGK